LAGFGELLELLRDRRFDATDGMNNNHQCKTAGIAGGLNVILNWPGDVGALIPIAPRISRHLLPGHWQPKAQYFQTTNGPLF
jgi:hypothetical protein